jgi:hypothetical protein
MDASKEVDKDKDSANANMSWGIGQKPQARTTGAPAGQAVDTAQKVEAQQVVPAPKPPAVAMAAHKGPEEQPLTLIIELWRADVVTSVVELDEEGNVTGGGAGGGGDKEALKELYPPGR